MSFGTPTYSRALETKIQEAADKGILLIAAAGNNGSEKNSVEYPAAYDEVIAVGSINATMERAEHSAQGEAIELMAPGENVPIESLLGATTIGSGTSYAAPHVTAVAALLWQEEPDWEAGKIRALLQAGARKLTEENSGYGLIDYLYTKSIQSDFDTTYEKKDKESAVRTYTNEEELEEYEMPKVVANWKSTEHKALINSSLGKKTETWQKKYTQNEINALQDVSRFLDKNEVTHPIKELHAGDTTNYVATTAYLYELAVLKWKNPSTDLKDLKLPTRKVITALKKTENEKKADSPRQIDQIKKAIKKVLADTETIKKVPGLNDGQNQSIRLLGMVLHVAGDAYAHKAMVPEALWEKEKESIYKDFKFKPDEKEKVNAKETEGTLTTAGIASENKHSADQQHKCHAATADNPKFLPKRYQYGSQHAVTALLRGYKNKTAECGSSVFYGEGKNTVKQYRIYTYIDEVYSIKGNAEREKRWKAISGADKKEEKK